MALVTISRLKSLLLYDRQSGQFYWRINKARAEKNDMAGCAVDRGYVTIKIDGRRYYAHRLAWFYVYGEWPKRLDHRDTDRSNNRISNLRLATLSQNGANRGKQRNNTSGRKGVFLDKASGKYYAAIVVNRKMRRIGTFVSLSEASTAYQKEARRQCGEFARVDCHG